MLIVSFGRCFRRKAPAATDAKIFDSALNNGVVTLISKFNKNLHSQKVVNNDFQNGTRKQF